MIAVFPGTFDPITLGHLDIIKRSASLFDKLIIGVGINPQKSPLFNPEARCKMIKETLLEDALIAIFALRGYSIDVLIYSGLTAEFAQKMKANVIVRAIRDFSDLQYEAHQARINRRISGIETLFLSPSDSHLVTSSTMVREIWEYGNRRTDLLTDLVPACVIKQFLEIPKRQ
jgi:pantetheine-phosphate adenylyltransferase